MAFFIVGNSRSGTTLLARILKVHPDVHVLDETHFMEEFFYERKNFWALPPDDIKKMVNKMTTIQRKGYYRKSSREDYPEEVAAVLARYESKGKRDFASLVSAFCEHEANRAGKKIWGDQTPRHVFFIGELAEMFPGARFIHVIRDPRAILLSQKRKWKGGIRWGQPKFEVLRTFLNYHPITTTIIWKKAIRAGLDAVEDLPDVAIKTIFFERLVADPEREVKKLCDFLDLDFHPEMLNVGVELSANKADEGKRGIVRSIAEHWKEELTKTEIFLAERLAGTEMTRLGYSLTAVQPSPLKLLGYLMIWPFQLSAAFILNLGRMGNPLEYVSKRLFHKQCAS